MKILLLIHIHYHSCGYRQVRVLKTFFRIGSRMSGLSAASVTWSTFRMKMRGYWSGYQGYRDANKRNNGNIWSPGDLGFRVVITGKGGVGKTTITAVLSHLFALNGFNTVAVDEEPKMNLPYAIRIPVTDEVIQYLLILISLRKRSVFDVFIMITSHSQLSIAQKIRINLPDYRGIIVPLLLFFQVRENFLWQGGVQGFYSSLHRTQFHN